MALAGHGLRRGYWIAAVLFTAAAVTVMCFSVSFVTTIHDEKKEPFELTVTAPSYLAITEQTIMDFRSIADVVDATGVLEVPATAKSEKYTTDLTLVGIDGDYLYGLNYTEGEPFPESGAMPWIILSKAAAQSFIDPADKTKHGTDYMPDIDWLNADFSLVLGDSTISAKVSGLFEGDEPAAYIGQNIAKQILQGQGLSSGYTGAYVRITNIGTSKSVSNAITAFGYEVANSDSDRQTKWDAQTRAAIYLAVLAVAGFFVAGMIRQTGSAVDRENEQRRVETLRWAGMSGAAIRGIGIVQGIFLALIGTAIGITVHYFIAALVGLNSGTTSNFALTLLIM